MTDFAAALTANTAGFTGGEGREVVVVNVALMIHATEVIQFLSFLGGAKCCKG